MNDVWSMIEDDPKVAANLRARSALMRALVREIRTWDLSQVQIAAKLNMTQARVSELLNGKIDKFSLDALVRACPRAGLSVEFVMMEEETE